MGREEESKKDVSSAQAVFMGALASGVNVASYTYLQFCLSVLIGDVGIFLTGIHAWSVIVLYCTVYCTTMTFRLIGGFLRLKLARISKTLDGSSAAQYGTAQQAPTWSVLKGVFLLLGVCFIAMFALAFSSSDFVIVAHVTFLVIIGAVLFVLLSGFLAQTGFVSVEQQMEEIGLLNTPEEVKKDK